MENLAEFKKKKHEKKVQADTIKQEKQEKMKKFNESIKEITECLRERDFVRCDQETKPIDVKNFI